MRFAISDYKTLVELLNKSYGLVCETETNKIIASVFLLPSGNPTIIYPNDWSYIRLLGVLPAYRGNAIGRELIKKCIILAKDNNEKTIALHTSEFMPLAKRMYEDFGFVKVKELDVFNKIYWLYKLDL